MITAETLMDQGTQLSARRHANGQYARHSEKTEDTNSSLNKRARRTSDLGRILLCLRLSLFAQWISILVAQRTHHGMYSMHVLPASHFTYKTGYGNGGTYTAVLQKVTLLHGALLTTCGAK